MTWWGLGSMAVGAVVQYTQADRERDIANGVPPKPVGTILSTPGGTTNPYGGSTYDPATGLLSQYSNRFDPRLQGRMNDADMMYNQFMGLGNERITGNLDFEIQQLEREIARLNEQQSGKSGVGRSQTWGELNPTLKQFVDKDGNPLSLSDLRANAEVINEFNKHVSKSKSSGAKWKGITNAFYDPQANLDGRDTLSLKPGQNPDFDKWFEEWRRNAGYDAAVKNYQDVQGKQEGNRAVRDQAIKTLQDKLGYAQKERERVAGGADLLAKNPLMKYLNDVGGGGMLGDGKGLPPWLAERLSNMDATAASARARSGGGPLDVSLDTSGIDEFIDKETRDGNLAAGLNTGYAGSINAPDLDLREAALRARALDAQTRQTFDAQRNLRDQQNARRGMLASSTSEIGSAGDTLGLANAMNANELGATEAYNRALAQQFGMDLGAEQFNAGERGNLFGRELGKAGFAQSERNRQFSNLLGQGNLKLGANQLRLASKSQADQQANWADTFANQTDQNALGQNQWLYGQRRSENQDAYSRNLGMYNLLNQNAAAARGEDRADFALGQNTGQAQRSDYWAGQQNQYNAAQAQMQNSQNMAGWNQQNAQRAAQNQMWGNLGQGLAQWGGNYFGGQQKANPGGFSNSYLDDYAKNYKATPAQVPNYSYPPIEGF